jgi:hypothetical protein
VTAPGVVVALCALSVSRVGGSGPLLGEVSGAAHAVPFSHPHALAAEIVAVARNVEIRTEH